MQLTKSQMTCYNKSCVTRRFDTERYRSGHNEAVLKTVCPKGRVGSNPTLSAISFDGRDG